MTTKRGNIKAKRTSAEPKNEPTSGVSRPKTALKPITADEQAIAARVAADSTRDWETIGEDSAIDYTLGRDKFELPPEAKKAQNERRFAFRWVARIPARIDAIRNAEVPEKWWVCNSTNTPFLTQYLDPVLGCICREDQILMFQPWWMRDKRKKILDQVTFDKSRDITRLNGQGKAGASFVAGTRSVGGSEPSLRQEVGGGDNIVFDEEAESSESSEE